MKTRVGYWISGLAALVVVSGGCVASVSGPYDDPSPYGHPYYPPQTRDYGYAREQFARLAHELAPLVERQRVLWSARWRPGGLAESAHWLERVLTPLSRKRQGVF